MQGKHPRHHEIALAPRFHEMLAQSYCLGQFHPRSYVEMFDTLFIIMVFVLHPSGLPGYFGVGVMLSLGTMSLQPELPKSVF